MESKKERRELHQAEERDRWFIEDLVAVRHEHGLTVHDVSERLGWPPDIVERFERGEVDPMLSSIRRYCLAVGARHKYTIYVPLAPEEED